MYLILEVASTNGSVFLTLCFTCLLLIYREIVGFYILTLSLASLIYMRIDIILRECCLSPIFEHLICKQKFAPLLMSVFTSFSSIAVLVGTASATLKRSCGERGHRSCSRFNGQS